MPPKKSKNEQDKFVIDFGNNVYDFRVKNNMTQGELARKSTLDRSHISQIELGERAANLRTIERLARGLGVQPSELMPLLHRKPFRPRLIKRKIKRKKLKTRPNI